MSALRKLIAAIEPWYDWGSIYVERMDGMTVGADGYLQSCGDGEVRYLQLQWLGLHLGFQIGRTPPRVAPVELKLPGGNDPAHVFEDHARWVFAGGKAA